MWVILLVVACTTAAEQIIYVDADSNGINDGSSWQDAFNYLQDALLVASQGDHIRVARGIYRPDQGAAVASGDRTATFRLKPASVTIMGGYAGFHRPDPNARNTTLHESILSGDLAGNDTEVSDACDLATEPNRADNSYHVLTAISVGPYTLLDGFTITGGHANESSGTLYNSGGGMYSNWHGPTLNNCTFVANWAKSHGGAIFTSDNIFLDNCKFVGNAAGWRGGGVFYYGVGDFSTLTNCKFIGNYAGRCGGGIHSNGHLNFLTLTNCTFLNNSAGGLGGGIYDLSGYDYIPSLINCTFIGNSAIYGGGIATIAESVYKLTLTNCKFIQNLAFNGNSPALFSGKAVCGKGGGLFSERTNPTLTNCVFIANSALGDGAGMCSIGKKYYSGGIKRSTGSNLFNCTFSGNSASGYGGGLSDCDGDDNRSWGESTSINCIFWGNNDITGCGQEAQITSRFTNVKFSCIQDDDPNDDRIPYHYGGLAKANIDDNPMFVCDPNDGGDGWRDDPCTPDIDEGANNDYGDLHLKVRSPCVDAGDNSIFVPPPVPVRDGRPVLPLPPIDIGDLDGQSRLVDGNGDGIAVTDMGAYEFMPGDFDINGCVNLRDFAIFGYAWLTEVGALNWNADCDISLRANNGIDMFDLATFFEHWLGAK